QVSNRRETRQLDHEAGPIEFGRGPKIDPHPRHVIQDLSVSRDHLRVEELPAGLLRVVNLSKRSPIQVGDSTTLDPLASGEFPLPLRLALGETLIDVEAAGDDIGRDVLATL